MGRCPAFSWSTRAASVSTPRTSNPRLAMQAAWVMPRYPEPSTVRRSPSVIAATFRDHRHREPAYHSWGGQTLNLAWPLPYGGDHQVPADDPAERAPDGQRQLGGERPEAVGERVVRADADAREIAEQPAGAAPAEGVHDRAVVLPVGGRLIRQPQRPVDEVDQRVPVVQHHVRRAARPQYP